MDGAAIYRIALGEDRHPDAWQLALACDAWPRVLIAPTGSGKTAAVTLGWAARRLQQRGSPVRRWRRRRRRRPTSPTTIGQLADAVLDAHHPGRMTLAIVNRVDGTASDKDAEELARPYETAELQAARDRLTALTCKDCCGEASGRPTICRLPTKRYGGSHAATRKNATAP